MFHVGQLVVCVNDDPNAFVCRVKLPPGNYWLHEAGLDGLKRGHIYTIRDLGRLNKRFQIQQVRLVEIVRPLDPDGNEAAYALERFRWLHDGELAVFRQHLAGVPKTEPVA